MKYKPILFGLKNNMTNYTIEDAATRLGNFYARLENELGNEARAEEIVKAQIKRMKEIREHLHGFSPTLVIVKYLDHVQQLRYLEIVENFGTDYFGTNVAEFNIDNFDIIKIPVTQITRHRVNFRKTVEDAYRGSRFVDLSDVIYKA